MSVWRFYPVVGYPTDGILVSPDGKAIIAKFYSADRLQREAKAKRAKALIESCAP